MASAASATIPAPANNANSAVTGTLADAALTGVERDSGARAAIATTAVAMVIDRCAGPPPGYLCLEHGFFSGPAGP
jgi:hypothetical protein